MKGYPKHLNTKQDIENIRDNHPEMHEQLKEDLNRILDEPDTVTKATELIDLKDKEKGYKTENTPNPKPKWKALGFNNKGEVQSLRNSI